VFFCRGNGGNKADTGIMLYLSIHRVVAAALEGPKIVSVSMLVFDQQQGSQFLSSLVANVVVIVLS